MATLTIPKHSSKYIYEDYFPNKVPQRIDELSQTDLGVPVPTQSIFRNENDVLPVAILVSQSWFATQYAADQAANSPTPAMMATQVTEEYLGNNLSKMVNDISAHAQVLSLQ